MCSPKDTAGGRVRPARVVVFLAVLFVTMTTRLWFHGETEFPAPGDPPFLTIFLIDGLSRSVFRNELRAGRLPNLEKMISEGAYIENGISAFPSMTGFGFYPFLTGRDATRSHVLGLRWFDRTAAHGLFHNYVGLTNIRMNEDIADSTLTLFEHFPDQYTTSINSFLTRGADQASKGGWSFFIAKHRELILSEDAPAEAEGAVGELLPDWRKAESRVMNLAVRQLERRPKIHWITLAMADGYQHLHGTRGEYVDIIRHVDGLIGRYREASLRLGTEGDRVYAVVSDHGVDEVSCNLDLSVILRGFGLKTTQDVATRLWSSRFTEPAGRYADLDVVVAVNGNMMSYLYLRHPHADGVERWRNRPELSHLTAYPAGKGSLNLIKALSNLEGVELVVVRDSEGRARIFGSRGEATIEERKGGYLYLVEDGDPLGYASDSVAAALLDHRPHDGREWERATCRSRFPDAVVRLHRLMQMPECGDLVVTAAEGFDFGLDYELLIGSYRGGHGGLRRSQLVVPFVLCGWGVRSGVTLECARSEDVGATFFELMGLELPEEAEGRVLHEILASRTGHEERAAVR
jgi:predicted AlkP superfamily pyrophosphatase or phosphodiesterase